MALDWKWGDFQRALSKLRNYFSIYHIIVKLVSSSSAYALDALYFLVPNFFFVSLFYRRNLMMEGRVIGTDDYAWCKR